MPPGDAAFVLLSDAGSDERPMRLYRAAVGTIEAHAPDDVGPALARVRGALAEGRHVAGFMAYAAGHALEPRLAPLACDPRSDGPLLWFGIFDAVELPSKTEVAALLGDPRGAWTGEPVPRIDRARYDAAFARVADYIAAGDLYQANLSFRADVPFAGAPLALYARLHGSGQARCGGLVFTGRQWLLSASPELFFALDGGTIVARPMKGTARRGATAAADARAAAALRADPKQRAENLMIVDLLRNDIARVAVPGTVAVPELFALESYPTLHTLTSTITARLDPRRDAVDALTALFPCGSVTGAPKIRAMEVIAEVEADGRAAYTGSIGWIAPTGDAAFNVVIRTLALDAASADLGSGRATIGLGSAIVADSVAATEWEECLVKAAFLGTHAGFDLVETMRVARDGDIPDLPYHLARLRRSAGVLGFAMPADLEPRVRAAGGCGAGEERRLRLLLAHGGATSIALAPLPDRPVGRVDVTLAALPVDRRDVRLRHKTSARDFYDDARAAGGGFEVAFVDPDGLLTEGSFTNLFVKREGRLMTPPATRGLLPGVLRQRLIDEGRAVEGELAPADLADGFLIGNALRGLIPARLVRRDRVSPAPAP